MDRLAFLVLLRVFKIKGVQDNLTMNIIEEIEVQRKMRVEAISDLKYLEHKMLSEIDDLDAMRVNLERERPE